ncbi:MAG: DedA family protein [Firmicutes bacterium]|nr:DedA family protein [Bacillota bacterium]
MEAIKGLLDFILHIDKHLFALCTQYGMWTHWILFLIIFCETGLVATPFLPGDSLLFAAGALAAKGMLKLNYIYIMLWSAAVIGDSTNYWIGRFVGPKVFNQEKSLFFKKEYLDKTQGFYDKHGKKTIIIARFMPIIRTFAPFVAGIGKMTYLTFLSFSMLGSVLWIGLFVTVGYFFGNLPAVQHNFTLVIMAIILISVVPGIVEYLKHKKEEKNKKSKDNSTALKTAGEEG